MHFFCFLTVKDENIKYNENDSKCQRFFLFFLNPISLPYFNDTVYNSKIELENILLYLDYHLSTPSNDLVLLLVSRVHSEK